MNLLIDLGNSRLKWSLALNSELSSITFMDYRLPDFWQNLREQWRSLLPPENIAIASVAAQPILDSLIALCRQLWGQAEIIFPRSTGLAFGVCNGYTQPERLGVDRWLALIGAHLHYSENKCVVDCGTAITLDVIRADGRHLGGLIAPGMNAMKQALTTQTAALQYHGHQAEFGLATATEPAIANGVLLAACGLIEQTFGLLDDSYRLILTGGDAIGVSSALNRTMTVDPQLVFKGLAAYCRTEIV